MNIIFKQDLKKRKQYLNCYARSKPLWKVKIAIMIILFIITLAIFVGLGYILSVIEKDSITIDIIFGFFLATLCIACFPFFMGLYFRNSARYHCAFPYSGMTNGILMLNDNKLEYVFWKASIDMPQAFSKKRAVYLDEDKFVYCFKKKEIESLQIDKFHICKIKGNGTLKVPGWASSEGVTETTKVNELNFLVSFEQDKTEEIIKNWRYT